MAKRLTIYDIKALSAGTNPYYFDRKTMRFFGQTLRMFSVSKQSDGRYRIGAPMHDRDGRYVGDSVRFFNPINNELERE